MPSRHEITLRTLRHQEREARAAAQDAAIRMVRDRGECRDLVDQAIAAVARWDATLDALHVAEAQMPAPTKSQE